MARWTTDQVLKLAPDAGSVRAARGLASPRTWSSLGSNESLVWGKCQGSGKAPYQVTVDLNGPAFKCTCPSRKFPCKHGLALLLMWAAGDGSVADTAAADFATAWAADRADRTANQNARRQARAESPPDPEAQARRQAERESLMSAGMDDFERWLFDLVRQGFAAARRQPFAFWDTTAGRLVDAQLPGLAERVRAAAGAVHSRSDWAEHLLAESARWYLAVRAWRARNELPPDLVADLRVVLGWSRRTDEVLSGARVHDRWHVIGLRQDGDERLMSQRTWLRGERTGEVVVVLDFAAAGAALAVAQVLGSIVEGEVALYPGSPPRRARFAGDHAVVGMAKGLDGAVSVAVALDEVATYAAANPWADRAPISLAGVEVSPPRNRAPAMAIDGRGDGLPLTDDSAVWPLLALSGGAPVDLFGEWADDRLHVCAVATGERLVAL